LTAFSVFADSGAKVSGRVIDANGAAVSGAVVQLSSKEGAQLSTVTDEKGNFTFNQLSAGDYLLQVKAAGFSNQVEQFKLTTGEEHKLDVSLHVDSVTEQIVVTASGDPQSVDETAKSVSVVDSRQLERRDDVSVADALRLVPGVRVEQLGGPGSFTKILVRGLRTADTSFLVDGIRIRDAADFNGSINPFLEDLFANN